MVEQIKASNKQRISICISGKTVICLLSVNTVVKSSKLPLIMNICSESVIKQPISSNVQDVKRVFTKVPMIAMFLRNHAR